jgi:uncharacterized protein YndB with AHSA1/START domain
MTIKPIARAEMLIRRPAAQVFRAFVDPAITSKFWFSEGTAPLEPGKAVTWTWSMYGFSVDVDVKAVEPNTRILVEWGDEKAKTPIEWTFVPRKDGTTFVSVKNYGFTGGEADAVEQALDSTEGFTFLLAGAKAWLEHGIQLNLVPDRHPDGLPGQGKGVDDAA